LPRAQQNARQADATRLEKRGGQSEVTIALATVTWRYVVPDVAAILRKKRSVDTVP
jgi:hypothetical protein